MKIVKWIILVLVLIIVVGGVVLYLNLNRIVRSTVASQSTQSLNLLTTVGGANVSLVGGNLNLSNMQIASPKGFSAPQLFTLSGIDVAVKYSQLRSDPIRIQSINIENPKLVLEQSGGKFNVQAVMDQLSQDKPEAPSDGKRQEGQPLRLIIDQLKVTGATVAIRPGIPGLKDQYDLTLPPINLANIGSGDGNQNGAAIKEVVMLLATTMASKAADSDQIPPQLKELLNLNVNQLAAKLQEKFNTQIAKVADDLAKKLPGKLGEALGGAMKNPEEALKNPGQALQQGLGGLVPGGNKPPATQPAKP
ncbi:MAG: AsmA family protein [Phycisphaerales bacterium]|jgi:uncharacterized protein involved in outer membrane biogenesis|nr:AsmA family protein [Phycisphaerales bacterium]